MMNTKQLSVISLCLLALIFTAVVPVSLSALHQRMQTTLCANNLRACTQAWNVYASEFDGKYIAPWSNTADFKTQSPYTMWYYVKGISLPGPAYSTDYSLGGFGWYNPETLSYGGFPLQTQGVDSNPQYHCPTVATEIVNIGSDFRTYYFRELLSYSQAIWDTATVDNGEVQYDAMARAFYARPELFTHPSTTILVQDISRPNSLPDTMPHCWAGSDQNPLGIHNGKDNFAFADGHVELLEKSQLTEDMFRLHYTLNE